MVSGLYLNEKKSWEKQTMPTVNIFRDMRTFSTMNQEK